MMEWNEGEPHVTLEGVRLATVSMSPVSEPKAIAFYVHGYDHHLRAAYIIKWANMLCSQGIAVAGIEFPGHGLSDGTRTLVDYQIYTRELVSFARKVALARNLPVYLMGESMGGAISILASSVLHDDAQIDFRGAVLFAPAIHNSVEPPAFVTWLLRNCCLHLCPTSRLICMPQLTPEMISQDQKRLDEIEADELMDKGAFRLFSGDSLLAMTHEVVDSASSIEYPFIIVHGTNDLVIPVSGSEYLFNTASTAEENKSLMIVEGAYHDILTDVFGTPQEEELMKWITSRV